MVAPRSLPPEARNVMRQLLHEMRTPLGQIIGYGEMIEEEMVDRGLPDLADDSRKIQGAARKLLDLLQHVFQTGPEAAENQAEKPVSAVVDAHAALAESPNAPRSAGGRLLVVDDEANNRDLLARRLRKAGYDVTTAEDGTRALRAIESEGFDLVLLDVLMPGLSGIEVLESIRRTRTVSDLPVVMATALGGSQDMVEALHHGANDYVTKPFDMPVVLARVETQLALRRSALEIEALARELEIRNAFIRRTFGRYVSEEVVNDLLERPDGLELSGEKRRVTILMSDLRGFSTLTERLTPVQVVSLLNRYLGRMAEIVQAHGGTVDEFIGDAVLAFFGAPISREDDAERAVAAAVAMQLAMEEVNRGNLESDLPEVEMGVGIATGEVIVGNVGSHLRTKYGAVGSPVNLASRIESFTLGGEVLICGATFAEIEGIVRVGAPRQVHPKGFDAPISIHEVRGVRGLQLADIATEWSDLANDIPVRFGMLDGKQISGDFRSGGFCSLSKSGARLRSAVVLSDLANLRIEILDGSDRPLPGAFYAKVVRAARDAEETSVVRFTTRSPALEQILVDLSGPR